MAQKQPKTSGGVGGKLSVDPSKPSDRALIRLAIKQRWPISEEVREELVRTTAQAMKDAGKKKNARDVAGCARVLVAADAVNLKEEQEDEKNARLDAGRATERVLLIDDMGDM